MLVGDYGISGVILLHLSVLYYIYLECHQTPLAIQKRRSLIHQNKQKHITEASWEYSWMDGVIALVSDGALW